MVSQSNSSDYYEEDDSQFLEALANAILPGDALPEEDREAKQDDIRSEELESPPLPSQPSLKRRWSDVQGKEIYYDATNPVSKESLMELEEDTYRASRFGGFGDYMRRKRAKLQIQNADMVEGSRVSAVSQIFKGISIYVSCLHIYCLFLLNPH